MPTKRLYSIEQRDWMGNWTRVLVFHSWYKRNKRLKELHRSWLGTKQYRKGKTTYA